MMMISKSEAWVKEQTVDQQKSNTRIITLDLRSILLSLSIYFPSKLSDLEKQFEGPRVMIWSDTILSLPSGQVREQILSTKQQETKGSALCHDSLEQMTGVVPDDLDLFEIRIPFPFLLVRKWLFLRSGYSLIQLDFGWSDIFFLFLLFVSYCNLAVLYKWE